jgi:hypothetical protein
METLMITGLGLGDESFTGEFGGRLSTYNVTKAKRDCHAGKHGTPYLFDLAPALAANTKVEVEPAKIKRFTTNFDILSAPLIMVIESGMAWLIDGHHRLRALAAVGATEFLGYVIEEENREHYLVRFNGAEKLPEQLSSWAGGPE